MNIMQEQPPYKITPDQAWAKMLPVLDKAMPVEKRSRRVIAFWWSAAAVVFIAVMSIINMSDFYQSRNDEAFTSTLPTEPITAEKIENQIAKWKPMVFPAFIKVINNQHILHALITLKKEEWVDASR